MRTSEAQRGNRPAMAAVVAAIGAIAMAALALPAPAGAASPPSVDSESVAELTSRHATLVAQINPNDLETRFEFWVQHAVCQNPLPGGVACMAISIEKRGEGTIKAGSTAQFVSATLKQLQPGYSYTYWVVATNSAGEAKGADQEFKALPLPVVAAESVSGVTASYAKLEAQINPEGQNVRYQFQIVRNPSEYAAEIDCPEPSLGPLACVGTHVAGALPIGTVWGNLENPLAAQPVSLDLESTGVKLEPDTTYHYRAIAAPSVPSEDTIEWEGPPVYGPDQTFTTPPAGAGPPVIESESVSGVTQTDATFEARINTGGLPTSYEFHVTGELCRAPCESPVWLLAEAGGKLLGSFVGQSVSFDLSSVGASLLPFDDYWVTATNAAGTAIGADQSLTPNAPLAQTSGGSDPVVGVQSFDPAAVVATTVSETTTSTDASTHRHRHHTRRRRRRKRSHPSIHEHRRLERLRHAAH